MILNSLLQPQTLFKFFFKAPKQQQQTLLYDAKDTDTIFSSVVTLKAMYQRKPQ